MAKVQRPRNGNELRVIRGTSDQARDMVLLPDEMFHADDTGARYVGAGQGGRARSLVMAEMNPDGGNTLSAGGIALQSAAELIDAAPTLPAAGVKVLTAIIRNPLADQARVNEPAEIRITLPDGWAPAVECIRVRDAAGVYVPWQWEPCRHARTGVVIATHASTNIKAGSVWIMVPSVPAGGEVTYTVEVWPTAQTQSFSPAITLGTTGSAKTYTGPGFSCAFTSDWTWHLSSYTHTASGKNVFAAATAGVDLFYKNASTAAGGIEEHSGPMQGAAAQTSQYTGERDVATFGYGVVYRWMIARSEGVTNTTLRHDVAYRVYANGRIDITAQHIPTALLATTDAKHGAVQVAFDPSGATFTSDGQELFMSAAYSGVSALAQFTAVAPTADEDGASFAASGWPGYNTSVAGSPTRLRVGWGTTNYAVPQNATRREYLTLMLHTDAVASARARVFTPLITTAAKTNSVRRQLQRFGVQARAMVERYTAWSFNDSQNSQQIFRSAGWITASHLNRGDMWPLVPGWINAWLAIGTRGAADAGLGARLFADYKQPVSGSGFEFVGTDADAFWEIYKEAIKRGDSTLAGTVRTIIAGIAEFARLAEEDNGSIGVVILNFTDNPPRPNVNSGFAAAMPIVYAETIGVSTPAQRDSLDRIWANLTGQVFFGWVGYALNAPTQYHPVIGNQVTSYLDVVMAGYDTIPAMLPRYTRPLDPIYPQLAAVNAVGQPLEHKYGRRYDRRGLVGPVINMACGIVAQRGNVSDIEQAITMIEAANATATSSLPFVYVADGWANAVSSTRAYGKAATFAGPAVARLTEI